MRSTAATEVTGGAIADCSLPAAFFWYVRAARRVEPPVTAPAVVVIGAGAAGCAAALEAARLGLAVTLIDEHPQSVAALGLDAPYFYGARLPASLSATMVERVLAANEPLVACFEAGVEVRTGTCVWGVFGPRENCISLDGFQLALAEGGRSEMLHADHLVFATGARDLVLSFPGWELPGVLGANGAAALAGRYQALGGERVMVLGSGNLGLGLARLLRSEGIEVVAVVEPGPRPRGDANLVADLTGAGVPIFVQHTIERALGETEVRAARLVAVDGKLQPVPNCVREILCDTIVMAYGTVPNVELPALAGCTLSYSATRGGWVPAVEGGTCTSLPFIHVAGDLVGTGEVTHRDTAVAVRQGQDAVRAIATACGLVASAVPALNPELAADTGAAADWLRSLLAVGGLDVTLCQCEEVTRRELVGVQPPRYLGSGSAATGGIDGLGSRARTSQDLLKRLTRVGMGHCQGKRCRDHGALLIAGATGCPLEEVRPGSYRAPVRPLPLATLWPHDESEEMRKRWPIWLHPLDERAPR